MSSGESWLGRFRGRASLFAMLFVIPLAAGAAAQGQDRPAPPRVAPKPAVGAPSDPNFESAKTAFEALPEADRKAIQDALVWTGDFNAVVSGAFGRRTFEALGAYRTRAGAIPSIRAGARRSWPPVPPPRRRRASGSRPIPEPAP
jgi:hypothetical protein